MRRCACAASYAEARGARAVIALLLAASLAGTPNGEALDKAEPQGIATPDLTVRTRGKDGKLTRSAARRKLFLKRTGYPNGRPGHRVDHIVPLFCSGADVPSNYAWQTVEEAKAKDRWELDCVKWQDGTYLRLLQRAIDEERGRQ